MLLVCMKYLFDYMKLFEVIKPSGKFEFVLRFTLP